MPEALRLLLNHEQEYISVADLPKLIVPLLVARTRAEAEDAEAAEFALGFNNASLEPEALRQSLLKERRAGRITVREAHGLGEVHDDDVLRGVLSLKDCARLVESIWNVKVEVTCTPEAHRTRADATPAPPAPSLPHRFGRGRENSLTHLVAEAMRKAADPASPASGWERFKEMAKSPNRPPPLVGYAEAGVKYEKEQGGGDDSVEILTKDNFVKRVKRMWKKTR